MIARLILSNGEDKGPHAFVIDLESSAGVIREDMPKKVAFNGLDNATIEFRDTIVPRSALLRFRSAPLFFSFFFSFFFFKAEFRSSMRMVPTCCAIPKNRFLLCKLRRDCFLDAFALLALLSTHSGISQIFSNFLNFLIKIQACG